MQILLRKSRKPFIPASRLSNPPFLPPYPLLFLSNRVDNKAYPREVEGEHRLGVECNAITRLKWRDWLHLLLFPSGMIHGAQLGR